jgi:transcriptional regulator
MYQPPHFREDDLAAQHGLIRARPLGTLVTIDAGGGLVANPLPFLLDADGASPLGTLRVHMARANPQWRDLQGSAPREALVIFQDVDGYVTPSWYATKREHGKVVPTWNYAAVHVWGPVRVIEDRAWLARQVADLTALKEAGRAEPWSVTDAPAPFVEAQLKGIVGLELPIARIEGKWKASQNRPERDRAGVVAGLDAEGDETTKAMARLVEAGGGAR